jgi:predicted aspartyl protease
MTRGYVNELRQAIVLLTVHGPFGFRHVEAVIDTGFNGALTLSAGLADRLGLTFMGKSAVFGATERPSVQSCYSAQIDWCEERLRCEAVDSALPRCLIGTELLGGRVLTIDFGEARSVEVR